MLLILRVKSKTFGDRAFEKMTQKLWNNLPQIIRSITDIDKFKSMLKIHLFDNYISYLIFKYHNFSLIFTSFFHTHRDYFLWYYAFLRIEYYYYYH